MKVIKDCHYCKYVLCSGVDDENPVCHLGDEDEDYYSHEITDSKQAEHCIDFIFCEPFPHCATCKHRNKSWDELPCDGCCTAHSGYEKGESE